MARLLLILELALGAGNALYGQLVDEDKLKAVFLYNFLKFVEWPENMAMNPAGICVLGESPVMAPLEQIASNNPGLVIRQISGAREATGCQIVFFGSPDRKRWRPVLDDINGNPKIKGVLTVAEGDGFLSAGGVMNLKTEGGQIRIQVNPAAAEKEKLRISSKLLSLAQIVRK